MSITARQVIDAINLYPRMDPNRRLNAVKAILGAAPRKSLGVEDGRAALQDNDIGALVTGQPDLDAPLTLDAGQIARILLNAANVKTMVV